MGIMWNLGNPYQMLTRLALFDLDNTLLAGDSDNAWGEFLIRKRLVDEDSHRTQNNEFYKHYLEGVLDIHAYVQFTLSPISDYSKLQRESLRAEFVEEEVLPMILEEGKQLVNRHRNAGDCCVIITATNSFITNPIAEQFKVDKLLATDLEVINDRFTGNITGTPCYKEGKLEKLEQWLSLNKNIALNNSIFYSDSINDMPLLEKVAEAVAVDPDKKLSQASQEKGWPIISLRN